MTNTIPAPLIVDHEFVVHLARYAEGSLTEPQVRKKYRFVDNATWERLGPDDELVARIEREHFNKSDRRQ
jgi:hypothetical protein